MTRLLLPALLCALTVSAQAQSPSASSATAPDGVPVTLTAADAVEVPTSISPTGEITVLAPTETSGPASRVAACTAGQTAGTTTITSLTTIDPGGIVLGQSFTAPCDGQLTSVVLGSYRQSAAAPAGTQYTVAVRAFDSDGPSEDRLAETISYNIPLPADATFPNYLIYNLPLRNPVEVVMGEVYTVFFEVTAGQAQWVWDTRDPYAGGQLYRNNAGDISAATERVGQDMSFRATFQPTTAASQSAFYNPSSAQGDGGGFRLLSAPVDGVPIRELAGQNLVQGVAAGEVGEAQYEDGERIIYVQYDGTQYLIPNSTDYTFQPGEGFFWYLFDRDVTPDPTAPAGPGTSTGQELTGFSLVGSGVGNTANVTYAYPQGLTTDGAYMLGNPFETPFDVSGVTVSNGTLQNALQAFDPETNSYVPLQQDDGTGASDVAAVWQGFFGEVTGGASDPAFTYAVASKNPGATPPFYGKTAPNSDVRLVLSGTLASGTAVHDRAAWVQLRDGADDGWDRFDASKLPTPAAESASIAPVGQRDGAAYRQAVLALAAETAEVAVPVAFRTSGEGTFTVRADALPEGRAVTLRDLETGAVADLADGELTFTASATGWADRFELVVSGSLVSSEGNTDAVSALSVPVPNPATRRAELSLTVAQPQHVRAALYDALGRQVAVLLDAQVADRATLAVDASGLATGVYVVRVEGESFAETQRLSIVR